MSAPLIESVLRVLFRHRHQCREATRELIRLDIVALRALKVIA